jgi:preprotein translocase subunit SecF
MPTNNVSAQLKVMRPMRYRLLYFAISALVIVPGIFSLFSSGLKLGIDFTGGTNITWQGNIAQHELEDALSTLGLQLISYSQQEDIHSFTIPPITTAQYTELKASYSSKDTYQELVFETVGPSLGSELLKKAIYGLVLTAIIIMLYIAYRFQKLKFGLSAILAVLHDILIVVGIFSLIGSLWGVVVDTLFVTALLTIISFSVYDTIVIFDRVRELKAKHSYLSFEDIVNRAVVESLGRSLNTSLTMVFVLVSMFFLGGETTKWFIFALLIGTISGTYSSTFTAAPILVVWDNWEKKLKKAKKT